MEQVVIVKAKRTPFGNFGGALKDITTVELGSKAVSAAIEGAVDPQDIDFLIMGNNMPGSGLSPARQVVMAAGWPKETNAMLLDRACCSSMSAIGIGFEKIMMGRAKIVVAGGMENMSRTPYLLPQLRWGQRIGDFMVKDELVIRNPYLQAPMAQYAGEVGVEWGAGRKEQDEWAVLSHKRAAEATEKGYLAEEMINVEIKNKKGTVIFDKDEHVRKDSSLEKLSTMEPVYGSPTVTAGNASGICDGASGVLVMAESEAKKRGLKPIARIVDWTAVSSEPRNSPLLPAIAINKILSANGMKLDEMKLIEVNEAFASMPLVTTLSLCDKDLAKTEKLRERVNVNGGAIAIGHPVGATGARLVMTLINELRRRNERYGIAAICGAIGQGDAIIVEAL